MLALAIEGGQLHVEFPDDLRRVVEAWPTLSEDDRRQILSFIDS